jgi:replicative DNA helicase
MLQSECPEIKPGRLSQPSANGVAAPQTFSLDLIDSATFDAADYSLSWLVNKVLVRDQPCIVGGPKKALKTSIIIDLAVSVAGGRQFLGTFYTPAPCRVCVLSGESGEATLQTTARRVAASKGLRLADLPIHWGFKLPQLSDTLHVGALQDALGAAGVRLLLFDPLYLALLAGQGPDGASASNLYQMGPLLLSVARACLDVGCTPALVHHFKLTRKDTYAEPQPEDLAFAGVQEFARQWILLGRRSPFDPDCPDGKHELWLSAGGSAGHSLLRAVDVCEVKLGDDFGGRT